MKSWHRSNQLDIKFWRFIRFNLPKTRGLTNSFLLLLGASPTQFVIVDQIKAMQEVDSPSNILYIYIKFYEGYHTFLFFFNEGRKVAHINLLQRWNKGISICGRYCIPSTVGWNTSLHQTPPHPASFNIQTSASSLYEAWILNFLHSFCRPVALSWGLCC